MLFGILLALPFALAELADARVAPSAPAGGGGNRLVLRPALPDPAAIRPAPSPRWRRWTSCACRGASRSASRSFAEVPDPWSILGMAIIAVALLAIVWARSRRRRPLCPRRSKS
jgi:hypothetical protein